MKKIGSYVLAIFSWLNVAAMMWGMILDRIPQWPTAVYFLFFVVVALVVSANLWEKPKKDEKDS